jgi:hypothetical protein
MRKVLESLGSRPTPKQSSQASATRQQSSAFTKGSRHRSGTAPRQVAVTVVRHDRFHPSADRQSPPVGLVDRLEAAETSLKTERAARTELERSLAESKMRIRDLQTQLAHGELAHREALAAIRADGETAQDLIRELRARLRATEDARQPAPDAINIESDARPRVEEAQRVERNTADHLGQQTSAISVPKKKGSSQSKITTVRQEPGRGPRKGSAASRKSGMQATRKRNPIVSKRTRSTPKTQGKKATRIKQDGVIKVRQQMGSRSARSGVVVASRLKRQKMGGAIRGGTKEKSRAKR